MTCLSSRFKLSRQSHYTFRAGPLRESGDSTHFFLTQILGGDTHSQFLRDGELNCTKFRADILPLSMLIRFVLSVIVSGTLLRFGTWICQYQNWTKFRTIWCYCKNSGMGWPIVWVKTKLNHRRSSWTCQLTYIWLSLETRPRQRRLGSKNPPIPPLIFSRFLNPVKFRRGVGKMSEWILPFRPRIKSLICFGGRLRLPAVLDIGGPVSRKHHRGKIESPRRAALTRRRGNP